MNKKKPDNKFKTNKKHTNIKISNFINFVYSNKNPNCCDYCFKNYSCKIRFLSICRNIFLFFNDIFSLLVIFCTLQHLGLDLKDLSKGLLSGMR